LSMCKGCELLTERGDILFGRKFTRELDLVLTHNRGDC
jgi:hypothetical protein